MSVILILTTRPMRTKSRYFAEAKALLGLLHGTSLYGHELTNPLNVLNQKLVKDTEALLKDGGTKVGRMPSSVFTS